MSWIREVTFDPDNTFILVYAINFQILVTEIHWFNKAGKYEIVDCGI